jgi:hypothetical protein
MPASFSRSVFINCPFDESYGLLFQAIVFSVHNCGFSSRCALESSDAGESRLAKIQRLIEACKFGIHDLSRVELTTAGLPRFNMPLELGLDMGCKMFGNEKQRKKALLILEKDEHRYDSTISDLSGQDISAHGGTEIGVIRAIRNWLARNGIKGLPGAQKMIDDYGQFCLQLPGLCKNVHLDAEELEFVDLTGLIQGWLERKG